ncbi:MAG: transketolase [Candidatus Latescibacteria bacterium]|nr:transketolase [Candidatus Latescibacterota bacterium]
MIAFSQGICSYNPRRTFVSKHSQDLDTLCVNTVRMLAVDAVEKATCGHPGMPMEGAPLAHLLWTRHMKYNPRNPDWSDRDRFVLSAGHGSMLLYGMLHLSGYDLSLDDLKNFRQWESLTPGHPEYRLTPGVETTTGPLGQGVATAVGMAMAEAHLAARYNNPDHEIVDHHTYVIASDGDLMEGVASEACSMAGHLGLGKLIVFYMDNHITIEGDTDLAFTENVGLRFDAYDWHVQRVIDGNDIELLDAAIHTAKGIKDKPSLVICRTTIGYGSPNKSGTSKAHGEKLGADEVALTKQNLKWPEEPTFHVPDAVREHYKSTVSRGAEVEATWTANYQSYATAHPDLTAQWNREMSGELPSGWDESLPTFTPDSGSMATRSASGEVLNAIAPTVQNLFGGSADLAGSNNTNLDAYGDFAVGSYHERNLHFGVREHAMASALNGMMVHGGIIGYGGTFLVFSDYMRPAIRLAALMEIDPIYVFTHESIGLGEDGPTHQPVEHYAALRAIPNVTVIRPSDATETVEAWRMALENSGGPTALLLTRQKMPIIDRSVLPSAAGLRRGAYVLLEAGNGKPDIILIASGSEVHVALDAQAELESEGIAARVVSMPIWELFDKQSPEYREQVLPSGISARLAIEAGVTLGWERYVGLKGKTIGLDRFGASAPVEVLMDRFGFTVSNTVAQAKSLL